MAESIVAQIKSAFRFLEAEYGLNVMLSREDEGKPYLGGWVEYTSPLTVVGVVVEKMGDVLSPYVGRARDQDAFKHEGRISLDRIYEYDVTTSQERMLLASHNPEELKRAWKAVVEPRGLDLLALIAQDSSVASDSREETELKAYAQVLMKHGEPFLRGDFSSWLELHEYKWNWLVATQIAHDMRWGEELTTENAEARLEGTRAYLEALRREHNPD